MYDITCKCLLLNKILWIQFIHKLWTRPVYWGSRKVWRCVIYVLLHWQDCEGPSTLLSFLVCWGRLFAWYCFPEDLNKLPGSITGQSDPVKTGNSFSPGTVINYKLSSIDLIIIVNSRNYNCDKVGLWRHQKS